MGLLANAEADVAPLPKGGTCTVARVRGALDPVDLETFNGWMASPREASWISRAIQAHTCDIELRPQAIQRHRRGECKCRA